MCAIAGIIGLLAGEDTIGKMLKTMERRGPDDQGSWQAQDAALLHRRLAIIDPSGGRQPMELQWAGERYILVYNGELYNTEQLRKELIREGHTFRDRSDTEVLLHAYAQWGRECLEKLNGIFAFGVWEEKAGRLFLARDRIGVKPLFYKLHGGGLIFASEIKTILQYPTVKAELDAQGAAEVIMLGPGRIPGSGVFRGIRELEPGCCGWYEDGKLSTERYWKLRDREHTECFQETMLHVRFLVQEAIRGQMVSDVPIGTFLSGGLDSSLISAICARETPGQLKTFSVDYRDNERYFQSSKFQPNADSHYIDLMKATLNTDHHLTVLTPEDLLDALEDATIARDLPGMADVDFSLLAFCREIRKDVKVALSGECADEIFGGYPWYRDPEVRDLDGFPWAQNTVRRSRMLAPNLATQIRAAELVQDQYLQTCRESDVLPGTSAQERRMKEMVNLNFRWFMQTLLDRKDRMSMYCGLEVRVPFCDYRITEYLYGVPWGFKDYQGQEKGLLRTAMTGWLPQQVLWRKKSPYPKTFDPHYAQLVSQRLESLLESDSPMFYLVDREAVRSLLTAEYNWPWYGQLMKGPQTMAWLLQIDFWLKHYEIDFVF